ncbi:hypothetical protein PVL96_00440 [Aeromonas hydrophila]|uniref:hypothetical protein n=1 Tax=Aeromonas hydrophila TaxID=644 RepID=UPI002379A3EF|nr:hypothetical protein [Aeromonas hydrophila]MDD9223502.1 hypothetical protein [Aeromonas hydrophila]
MDITGSIELKKLLNQRTVSKLAEEMGYEVFKEVVEKFNVAFEVLDAEHKKEQGRLEKLDAALKVALEAIPAELRDDVLARMKGEQVAPVQKEKKEKGKREVKVFDIKTPDMDKPLAITMSGRVKPEIQKIMDDHGCATRKELVEKFGVTAK